MEQKTCKTCKVEKPLSEFYKRTNRPSHDAHCRECRAQQQRQYRIDHPEYVEKRAQQQKEKYWQDRNAELPELLQKVGKIKVCTTCGYEGDIKDFKKDASTKNAVSKIRLRGTCKKCANQRTQKWLDQNPEKRKTYNKRTYDKRVQDPNFKQYKKDIDKQLLQNPEYREKKRQRDRQQKQKPIGIWRRLLANSLRQLGQTKTTRTQILLGYTANELFNTLGVKPTENHALDHKVPLSWLLPTTPPNIACNLNNLHWLTEEDNQKKNNWYADPIPKDYFIILQPHIKPEYQTRLVKVGDEYHDNKKEHILDAWRNNRSCI